MEMVNNNSCSHSFCIQENISRLKSWSLQTNQDRALFSSVLPNGNRGEVVESAKVLWS
jgi:hypothetical protein